MKRVFFTLVVMSAITVSTVLTSCRICTKEFVIISIKLQYPDSQPVVLDSCKVFWVRENLYLEHNSDFLWNGGNYLIVDDGMQDALRNRKDIMRFTGYLNDKIVFERDVLVGADRCHVSYLGTEALTYIIQY